VKLLILFINVKKQCSNYNGNHFSFLCLARSNRRENLEKSTSAVIGSSTSNISNRKILSTFTTNFSDLEVRVLKDCGAQTCFITSDLAKRANLKIVTRINMTLSGFVASDTYDTRIFEVPLKVGDTDHLIEAVCVHVTTKFMSQN